MLPLIPLALSFVPELVRLIAGDSAGKVANSVASVVSEVTGTTDPAAAQKRVEQDPQIASQLRIRLAEIAVEAQKAQNEENERKRQAELAQMRASLENTAGARSTMLGLVQSGSPIAWAPPIVSVVVTLGFFVFVIILLFHGLQVNDVGAQIINIAVGVLTAAFATVINYWLGSSQGSRDKDEAVRRFQAVQADQTNNAINSLKSVATTVATTAPAPALAFEAPPRVGTERAPMAASRAISVTDNFEKCVGVIFAQEGGFGDDPKDPGGATNMGITLKTLSDWRGTACTVEDVRNLTKREAQEIYRANYWNPMRCGDLPPGVDLMVFDFGVNAGPRTSVKLMQRVLGVTDDGSVGPRTLEAARNAKTRELIRQLAEARIDYYRRLPGFERFGSGWTTRTQQVESSAEVMCGVSA